MKYLFRNAMILSLGVSFGVIIAIGGSVLAERDSGVVKMAEPLPLEELRTFTEVFGHIKGNYVDEVSDKDLLESAIRGMLTGLDPHSTYLNEEAFEDLQVGTRGEFGGLGIEVGMEDGFVKVIAPIDDTPAQRAGVKAGDLVIRLDDTPVKGMSLREAVSIMRGKPGSDILLTIVREGTDKPLKITITRAVIKVKSVKSRLLDDGFAYVRITQFQSHTGPNMLKAIDELKEESDGELRGLILDLRNNPGGVLNAAVDVSDAFLDKGLVVYTEGREQSSRLNFNATPNDHLKGAPVVVLVNGGSASASEIVSGALQDHKRAIIMGTKTFGKGSVQTILPIKDGVALKLTTARYYTPSGRTIQAEGITPDILLERVTVSTAEPPEFKPVTEASLSRHLENTATDEAVDEKVEEGDEPTEEEKKAAELAKLAGEDYQLYEALNLLRGLAILQERM